ncbi:hypothetical protein SAMN04488000_13810 [Lentzea albida]|uniref:Uncharacterized protein n=2 Tax=Lentzea albida TaxID=65499 RepID=A0A1H9XI86_9PSEU|nr:hypothetical protein SAMN04488000_13810 [Lentzea albida]
MADEFRMDFEGVQLMAAQLHRAGADAESGAKHVAKHGDLSWVEHGVLLDTLAARHHERIFQLMRGAIKELADRTNRAARAVDQTSDAFGKLDGEEKQEFDRLFRALDGPLPNFTRRYGGSDGSPSFADKGEPSDSLTDPELHTTKPLFEYDWRQDLLSVSAAVRGTAVWIVGKDPFQEAFTWLTGDWAGFQRCSVVWAQVGRAAEGIGRNIANAGAGSEWVWEGRSGNEAREYLLALADAATDFAPVCQEVAKRYQDAVTAVRAFSNVVTTAVSEMVDAAIAFALTSKALTRAANPAMWAALLGLLYYWIQKFRQAYEYLSEKQTEVSKFYDRVSAWFATVQYRRISQLRPPALLLSPGSPL